MDGSRIREAVTGRAPSSHDRAHSSQPLKTEGQIRCPIVFLATEHASRRDLAGMLGAACRNKVTGTGILVYVQANGPAFRPKTKKDDRRSKSRTRWSPAASVCR